MTKEQDLGETIDLGVATVETRGEGGSSHEIMNNRALKGSGLSDED